MSIPIQHHQSAYELDRSILSDGTVVVARVDELDEQRWIRCLTLLRPPKEDRNDAELHDGGP